MFGSLQNDETLIFFLHSLFTLLTLSLPLPLDFRMLSFSEEEEIAEQHSVKSRERERVGDVVCMTSRSSVLLFQYQFAPNSSTDNKFYWQRRIESERD